MYNRCVCVCAIGKRIPREFLCAISVHRKYHLEALELHQRILASKPCVTDLLCNWEINSQMIKICICNHFGPHSVSPKPVMFLKVGSWVTSPCSFTEGREKGIGSVVVGFGVFGRPDFPSRGPKTLYSRYFGTSGLKIGAPQKRQIQP